jgi:hypothetical protein
MVVFFLVQMLPTINFDDQALSDRTKISDVGANGMLAAKPDAVCLFHAQAVPEHSLCTGEFATQFSCK